MKQSQPFARISRTTLAVAICTVVFFLTAVGSFASGTKEQSAAASQSAPQKLNIIIGSWAPDVLKPYFEKYGKEHNLQVVFEAYPFRDLFDTIQVRHAAQAKNIDAIFVDAPDVAFYATGDYILPLNKYFSKEMIDSTWAPASAGSGSWDGKFYAPPLNNSSQVLFYNKDLLKKAGVSFPSDSVDHRWTWAQVVDAAKKVTDKKAGIWGFAFDQINRYYQLQPLPMSLGGGDGISADGKTAQLATKPWIDAFTWYKQLFNTWNVSPKGVAPEEVPQLFAAGKMGLFAGGLWNIVTFNKAGVNFAVAPYPYFAGGKPVTPMDSWHVGVWSYTQHEAQAADFVKYLTTNKELLISWLDGQGQFPALKVALQHITESPKYEKQPFIAYRIALYEASHTAEFRAKTPVYLQFEQVLDNTFEDIRNGADVTASLTSAQKKVDGFLNQYYSQHK